MNECETHMINANCKAGLDGAAPSPLGSSQQCAWGAMLVAHARLTRRINATLESEGLLSLELYDVLLALEEAPDHRLRMCELAALAVFSPSGLTRLVDRLEKLGYVRREQHPTDRRSTFARITNVGLQMRAEAWPRYRELIYEHFGKHLTKRESEQIVTSLRKVVGPGCRGTSAD